MKRSFAQVLGRKLSNATRTTVTLSLELEPTFCAVHHVGNFFPTIGFDHGTLFTNTLFP